MRSNYRRIGGYGDLLDDVADLFKDESEIAADTSKEWNEACPPGATRQPDGSCRETSCPAGYMRDMFKGCIRSTSTAAICPSGLFAVLRGDGTHDCVSCPPGMETRSPHDPTCVPGAFTGGAALSAGGGIADFFANLFNGGGSTAAPAVSTGGGTISPGTPVPKMVPGTSFVIPDKGAATSPVVVGTPASSNIPTALLVLGAVGLLGGAVYVATR